MSPFYLVRAFLQPHPSSIPFVIVEMVSTLQYLPHAMWVDPWHERSNIWLASFENPTAFLSLD